jgi:hypothetical protein
MASSALHCFTCNQPLPEGEEPAYFGQTSVNYTPDYEVERAAEDVSQFLRYAQTVNAAAWNMLQIVHAKAPQFVDYEECYLDEADSPCFLLADLVEEASRRVKTLSRLVDEKLKSERAHTAAQASREGAYHVNHVAPYTRATPRKEVRSVTVTITHQTGTWWAWIDHHRKEHHTWQ